jgi:ketosteroid isomerase-like protein
MNADQQISEADVRNFLTRYEHASATQSFANVVGLIHPDALFRFSDGDFRGYEAIQAAFERTWAYDVEDERYYLTDVEVMNTDANSATATFTFNWSGTAPKGRLRSRVEAR